MLKKTIWLMGLACLYQSAAYAEDNDNTGFFIAPSVGYLFVDDDRVFDDFTLWGADVGYLFNKNWGVQVGGFGLNDSDSGDVNDADGNLAILEGLYYFNTQQPWKPYLAFGAGRIEFEPDNFGDDVESTVNFGAGLQYSISYHWKLRADWRAYQQVDESELHNAIRFGISYFFGHKKAHHQPHPVVSQPEPIEPLKAEVVPVKDTDQDGVIDAKDQCPDTPLGAEVDEKGCPIIITETVSIDLAVNFDTNQSVVKPSYFPQIAKVAEFMKRFPLTEAVIEGHTDSSGAADYNQRLSEQRAQAVRQVLIQEFAVDSSRIKAQGFGESQPIADNTTAAGRQSNRRVVAVINAQVEAVKKK